MIRKVVIRKAMIKDVPSIVKLWKELMDFNKQYGKHWTRSKTGHKNIGDFIRDHIKDDAYCILVSEANKNIIGYCLSERCQCIPQVLEIQEYGRICNLAVTKNYRGKGIGERLLKKTTDRFSKKGIHHIEACVSTSNKLARKFWAKMGFRPYFETVLLEI